MLVVGLSRQYVTCSRTHRTYRSNVRLHRKREISFKVGTTPYAGRFVPKTP